MTGGITSVGLPHTALLAALHGQCFDEAWDEPAMIALLAMPGALALLAADAAAPAGFLLGRIAGGEGEILAIGVLPDKRRSGVAAALVGQFIAAAQDAANSLFLEVAADNVAARALYNRLGFVDVGLRRQYYADRRNAVVMQLTISPSDPK